MSLADVLRKTERYEESQRLYISVLKAAEKRFGRKSNQVASCLNALGILTKKLGRYDAAIKYYKAAVKLMVFLTGSHKHAQIAEFLTNLADVYRKKSEYGQAEALYRRALEIFDQTVGSEHIECADVYNSLGLVAKKVGRKRVPILFCFSYSFKQYARYDEAADLYDRALSIARKTFKDKPHYKIGIYGFNRGDIERKRGNYAAALEMYNEALSMIRSTVKRKCLEGLFFCCKVCNDSAWHHSFRSC